MKLTITASLVRFYIHRLLHYMNSLIQALQGVCDCVCVCVCVLSLHPQRKGKHHWLTGEITLEFNSLLVWMGNPRINV